MKVEMSNKPCQPPQRDLWDCRRTSLTGSRGSADSRNSSVYLPHLSRSDGSSSAESGGGEREGEQRRQRRQLSDPDQHHYRHENLSRRSYDSSGGNSSGTPTKFPQISDTRRRKKSQSVTSLFSNKRKRNPPRAEICKSPSCPSLWSEFDDPGFVEDGDLNASIHPVHTRRSLGGSVKLPDLYHANRNLNTSRSTGHSPLDRSCKIEKELQRLTLRRQRENADRRERQRYAQKQLDQRKSQPVALLLPIRDSSRAKKSPQSVRSQRQSSSSGRSYHSTYSSKSDSGISTSVRQSDASETSHRPEESEWSGWEEGDADQDGHDQEDDDDDDEFVDADPGYEEEEFRDAEEEPYYEADAEGYRYYEREKYAEEEGCEEDEEENQHARLVATGYKGPRYRRYRVARSQNAQDYQPRPEMDPQEKCQKWLHGKHKKGQQGKAT